MQKLSSSLGFIDVKHKHHHLDAILFLSKVFAIFLSKRPFVRSFIHFLRVQSWAINQAPPWITIYYIGKPYVTVKLCIPEKNKKKTKNKNHKYFLAISKLSIFRLSIYVLYLFWTRTWAFESHTLEFKICVNYKVYDSDWNPPS